MLHEMGTVYIYLLPSMKKYLFHYVSHQRRNIWLDN